ncbi:PREDICTED: probable S-adenosylmethionine-dependent methyltransferase At5g38100 [Theobroma cacao]|uniref:Probable S-adenosylmethionine-dependent methyltransferase At5g38100 n=1 Tax=Theobroma cacao TaxID=3641 RepID=A0AB32VHN9_THECC|nr:PREDICTED: probable S-adenosylmethionine-dependent methyltransferase At5g38100 [Theobroma cacao]
MSNNTGKVLESYPMNGGDGAYSYTKNSYLQRAATSITDAKIHEAITEKLDIGKLSSTSNTLRIADLGCSVGPNTFIAMQNVLEAMQHKHRTQDPSSKFPEFQVLYNDHASNDFNTLFASLPSERQYFAAGVPGSFYNRLFPKSSLHFVHSSYALQWLAKVPEEVLDKNSPAWNKGRIHYTNAAEDVGNAYAAQFAKDMGIFLDARAKELVAGGMMVLILPSIPDGIPNSRVPAGVMFDLLGSSLMDMAKEEIISESLVDSFNLPVYAASLKEMKDIIERNGCFSIEKIETTNPLSKIDIQLGTRPCTMHLRAGMEGIISKHFGNKIIDELFDRLDRKAEEYSYLLNASYTAGTQLFIVLTRK